MAQAQSNSPARPTLVFVPGAWHTPAYWNPLIATLEPQGRKCIAVSLPSVTTDEHPTATFHDDLEAVRGAITGETSAGRDVVVVAHSYGGVVGGSAVKGLTRPRPTQHGDEGSQDPAATSSTDSGHAKGHVIGLVLIASGFMPSGVTFLGAAGGIPPPTWRIDAERNLAIITVDPIDMLYHDMPRDEAEHWVSQLQNQSLKAFTEGAEDMYSGWKDVPVWYVGTVQDRGLPVEMQRAMVEMVRGQGADVVVRELDGAHSVMLSRTKDVAGILGEAVEAFVGK